MTRNVQKWISTCFGQSVGDEVVVAEGGGWGGITAIVPLSLFVCYQESKAHMLGNCTASLRRPSVVDK